MYKNKSGVTFEYNTTPVEFLRKFAQGGLQGKSESWIRVQVCPFCKAVGSSNAYTFVVHSGSGSFKCHRATCNKKGGFADLIRAYGQLVSKYLLAVHDPAAINKQPLTLDEKVAKRALMLGLTTQEAKRKRYGF